MDGNVLLQWSLRNSYMELVLHQEPCHLQELADSCFDKISSLYSAAMDCQLALSIELDALPLYFKQEILRKVKTSYQLVVNLLLHFHDA
jgi:hypothetical protein